MDAGKPKEAKIEKKVRKPYRKPAFSSEKLFEGTVLACAKVGEMSCGPGPLVSS